MCVCKQENIKLIKCIIKASEHLCVRNLQAIRAEIFWGHGDISTTELASTVLITLHWFERK